MGCGCGKGKNNRRKSSRMPVSNEPRKIRNITIPSKMTPNQRRSAMVKIQNQAKSQRKENVSDIINNRKNESGGN
tara:strand:+ start:3272 stop:3496 length:225 start_codon:yes stop_codon:yes gene_type:complete